jgi:hypothetical protein
LCVPFKDKYETMVLSTKRILVYIMTAKTGRQSGPCVVVYVCNPSTWEAEAGGSII